MRNLMMAGFQTTLSRSVSLEGLGVHSGVSVDMTMHPAESDTGIVFVRADIDGEREIPALYSSVVDTVLCTVLGEETGATVATVEHVLAALAGLGVDNAVIEINGAEVPILDGSARPFVEAIDRAGITTLRGRRRCLRVLKPVRVGTDAGFVELSPAVGALELDVSVDYETPVIGRQRRGVSMNPGLFRRDVSGARTFGFVSQLDSLRENGLALGASLDNAVAIDGARILNPEGLRFTDEFVRHKMLDAVGDLALAGAPLEGRYRGHRAGHRLNVLAVKALMDDPSAWTLVEAPGVRQPVFDDGARAYALAGE